MDPLIAEPVDSPNPAIALWGQIGIPGAGSMIQIVELSNAPELLPRNTPNTRKGLIMSLLFSRISRLAIKADLEYWTDNESLV